MWGFGLLRSPRLLLLLPQLGLGIAASRSQAGTMNLGGGSSSARCSPSDEDRQCLHLSTVPGADPQRSNELLLLVAAAEGPERRGLSGDRAKEGPQPQPQHHVLYFPGDVQVTWGLPGHLFLLCICEFPRVSPQSWCSVSCLARTQPHMHSRRWLFGYSPKSKPPLPHP